MELVKELFDNTYLAPHLVYLDSFPRDHCKNAAKPSQIRDVILVAEKDLWPEDLIIVGGCIIEDTGYFTSIVFSNIEDTVDYCFQVGRDGKGEEVATLVKVSNLGPAEQCDFLFKQNGRAITDEGQLLEAKYLATYKDNVWYVLDEEDRNRRLDCESQSVLDRCYKVVF